MCLSLTRAALSALWRSPRVSAVPIPGTCTDAGGRGAGLGEDEDGTRPCTPGFPPSGSVELSAVQLAPEAAPCQQASLRQLLLAGVNFPIAQSQEL